MRHHDHHDRHEGGRRRHDADELGFNQRRHGPHPMGPGDFGRMGPRRMRRGRRGDVRAAVLLLLEEQPRNGYQLMEESEQRSGGAWRPSPGSVYPVLSQLEDEGLISATADADGRKQFELTPLGKTTVEQQRAALGQPFDAAAARFGEPRIDLAYAMRHLHVATRQVMESGSQEQVSRAGAILKDARRQLYRLLGEEDEDQ